MAADQKTELHGEYNSSGEVWQNRKQNHKTNLVISTDREKEREQWLFTVPTVISPRCALNKVQRTANLAGVHNSSSVKSP